MNHLVLNNARFGKFLARVFLSIMILTGLLLSGVFLDTAQTAIAASPATLPPETLYSATDSGLTGDDVINGPYPIGFSFTYYGNTYTQMEISTNGLVCFGGQGSNTWTEQPIPNSSAPNNCIFAFWDDLYSYNINTQPILYRTIGSSPNREAIIQWTNYGYFNSDLPMGTFQVILYEGSNAIRMQYRQLLTASRSYGQSAAIGLENYTGTAGIQFCYDSACLTPEQSILWTPSGSTYTYNAGAPYEGVYLYKDNPPPTVPTLLTPSNGSAGVSTSPTFTWQASTGATAYNLRVSTNSNLSSPVISANNLTSLSYSGSGLSIGPTYYWGVQAVNAYGDTWSSIWNFTTAAGNSAPTALSLSNDTLSAGQPINTVVGTLTTTDPDVGNTFTYTLVSGAGSGNNASFNISGNQLRTSAVLTAGSYYVRIRTTDQGGLYLEQAFVITATSSNSAPTDIQLSSTSIAENQPANTTVGTLSTTDANVGDTFTYTLVSGTGDTDNASFNISGSSLRATSAFNYETKSSYTVRVRSTDQGGLYTEKQFSITVTDANESPTDISLSASSIAENQPANTTIGSLSSTDPDSGNTFTYSLVTGTGDTDNTSFNISGNNLRTSASFNYETKSSYTIRVRSTDQGGLYTEKQFSITVTDVNESPVITEGSTTSITMSEDGNPVAFALTLHASDPDNDTLTWSISGQATSGIAAASGTGTSKAISYTPTTNYNGSDSFTVQVVDGKGGTDTIVVNVTISAVDDPPQLTGTTPTITFTEDDPAILIDPDLTFTDIDGPNINGATIAITSGYVSGQDTLGYTASGGITGSFNSTTGVLTLSGSSSVENYQTVLRSVTYRNTSQNPNTTPRAITFVGDNTLFNISNGHFYEFITNAGIAWNTANAGASSQTLYGMQGYLATITSSQENAFITGRLQGVGWIGASDAATEETWKWVSGPESGTTFCIGTNPCVVQSGQYANWNSGEPNNAGDEDYGHMIYNTAIGTRGSWNDLPLAGGSGDYSPMGYVVEFGGIPGDPTIHLTASATIQVEAVNDAPVITEGVSTTLTTDEDTTGSLTLHAADVDSATLTWSILSQGSKGTASASGTGTSKLVNYTPDLDVNGTDSFVVQVSDGNLTDTITVNVTINPINDEPTDIALSADSIAENQPDNTTVGTLSTTDPETGDTFTYTLVTGTGDTDNTSFNISGSSLRATTGFDYETKSGYTVRVRSTDQGGLYTEKAFAITVTDVKEDTSVEVSSTSPTVVGETYSVSVTVSPAAGGGTPTGDVSVSDGTGASCEMTLANGSGSCELTSTSAGAKTLTADYEGDENWNSNSGTTSHVVNKANTTTTISAVSKDTTVVMEPYTVSVSVVAVAPGSGIPGGTVTVSDDDSNTCTITLSEGTGNCELSGSSQGLKTLTADYNGDANYSSSSDTESHSISLASTTTTITDDSPDPNAPGEVVTFSVNVTADEPSTGTPSGTVGVYEGTTLLCNATLSGGSGSCTNSDLTVGEHTIAAEYEGSPNTYSPSSATPVVHTVEQIILDDNATSTSFSDVGHFNTLGLTDTFTYSLETSGRICNATNGAGNNSFEVEGNLLKRKTDTGAGTYSICVQSVDSADGTVQAIFSVIINNPPSDLSLDHDTVNVSQSIVGTLSSENGWDPQVFSLETAGPVCTAENSAGNSFFKIEDVTLKRKSNTPVGSYPVCIQVKDANDEIAQRGFTITVTDAPTGIQLSRDTVSTAQTDVGTFSLSNGQSPFIYTLETSGTLCNGTNGRNNNRFTISGDILQRKTGTPAGNYAICVQAEDANTMKTQATFTIKVTDPPSDLTLSNNTVTTAQTIVGTMFTVQGQLPFTYTLQKRGSVCNVTNAIDNVRFEVEGNALKRRATTPQGTYQICLQTEDANQERFQKSFTIEVSEGETPPADWTVSLTSNKVMDGDGPGTRVGTVISSLPHTTFKLVDPDIFPLESAFYLSPGGNLNLAIRVNIKLQKYYPIRIQATASDGRIQTIDAVIEVMDNGGNSGAVAVDDFAKVIDGASVEVDVLANDILSTNATDWSTLEIIQYPEHGTARIGSIIYRPNPDFTGTEIITYRACDNLGSCVTGKLTVTVRKTADTMPETGFAPNRVTSLAKQPVDKFYTTMDEMDLVIPALGVDVPVVGVLKTGNGWDATWLGSNAGWLEGSAFPTWNGNSVLTGHNYNSAGNPGIFFNLENLHWGDEVIIQLYGQAYVFEVRQVLLNVDPSDVDTMMTHKETPWLTLVTCRGYNEETGSYQWRILVRAVLVKVE